LDLSLHSLVRSFASSVVELFTHVWNLFFKVLIEVIEQIEHCDIWADLIVIVLEIAKLQHAIPCLGFRDEAAMISEHRFQ